MAKTENIDRPGILFQAIPPPQPKWIKRVAFTHDVKMCDGPERFANFDRRTMAKTNQEYRGPPPTPKAAGDFGMAAKYFVAKEDYEASCKVELTFPKNAMFELYEEPTDGFYEARNVTTGDIGLIPCDFVEQYHMEDEPWYFSRISREVTHVLLYASDVYTGTFLIRQRQNIAREWVLSLKGVEFVRHYVIRVTLGGLYWVQGERDITFENMRDLIEHHSTEEGRGVLEVPLSSIFKGKEKVQKIQQDEDNYERKLKQDLQTEHEAAANECTSQLQSSLEGKGNELAHKTNRKCTHKRIAAITVGTATEEAANSGSYCNDQLVKKMRRRGTTRIKSVNTATDTEQHNTLAGNNTDNDEDESEDDSEAPLEKGKGILESQAAATYEEAKEALAAVPKKRDNEHEKKKKSKHLAQSRKLPDHLKRYTSRRRFRELTDSFKSEDDNVHERMESCGCFTSSNPGSDDNNVHPEEELGKHDNGESECGDMSIAEVTFVPGIDTDGEQPWSSAISGGALRSDSHVSTASGRQAQTSIDGIALVRRMRSKSTTTSRSSGLINMNKTRDLPVYSTTTSRSSGLIDMSKIRDQPTYSDDEKLVKKTKKKKSPRRKLGSFLTMVKRKVTGQPKARQSS